MATIDRYKILVEVVGEESVKKLKSTVDGLGTAATAATAGLAALFGGAIRMADAVSDLADATGLSAGYIRGLGLSIQQAGGDINDTESIITKFYKTLGEMRDGSKSAADALRKVGITAKDLKTLSDRDLLNQAIQSLAQMEAGAARTAAGIEVFGKKFAAIDPAKLAEIFATQDVDKLTAALEEAGAMAGLLEVNYANLQQAAVNVLAQMVGETNNLTISTEKFESVIKAVGAALALYFGAQAISNILQIGSALFKFLKYLQGIAAVQTLLTAISGPRGLALVIAGGVAAAGAMAYLSGKIDDYSNEADKATSSTKNLNQQFTNTLTATEKARAQMAAYKAAVASQNDALRRGLITQEQYNKNMKALEPLRLAGMAEDRPDKPTTGTSRSVANQRQIIDSIRLQTQFLRQQLDIQNQYRQAQINIIGLEGNRANLLRQNLDLEQQFALESLDFAQQIAEEYSKGSDASQEVIKNLREQLLIKRGQIDIAKALNAQEAERLQLQEKQSNRAKALFTDLDLTKQQKMNEAYLASLDKIGIEYEMASKQLQLFDENLTNVYDIMKRFVDLSDAELGTASIIKIKDLTQQFSDTLTEAYSKIDFGKQGWESQITLIKASLIPAIMRFREEIKKYTKEGSEVAIDALMNEMSAEARRHAQKMQNLDAENQKQMETLESYRKGVEAAMANIAESFRPYRVAQDLVQQGWGRMSDALDEFVETGKLNFADLARSIIQDITKMIIKMLIFKAIEAGLNAIFPGAGTAFAALTGKANGGPVNKNTPYIVGERGPELFVPQKSGNIVPNNKLNNGMSEMRQPVTNNTYNNYYINALDAKSVAQVFAENRKALFGANKMAEREMSYAGVR